MSDSKSFSAHIALIFCNIVWACDYPFYNLVLGRYISPLAMVSASLAGQHCVLRTLTPAKVKGAEAKYSQSGRYYVTEFDTEKGGVYTF